MSLVLCHWILFTMSPPYYVGDIIYLIILYRINIIKTKTIKLNSCNIIARDSSILRF